MKLFLDTEWADTLGSELVSLALISADSAHHFYVERDPLPSAPTDFVRAAVYPLLDRGAYALCDEDLTRALRRFLVTFEEIVVLCDYPIDAALFQYALDGFESQAELGLRPVVQVQKVSQTVRMGVERYFQEHPDLAMRRHHAAVDAEALRYTYLALHATD